MAVIFLLILYLIPVINLFLISAGNAVRPPLQGHQSRPGHSLPRLRQLQGRQDQESQRVSSPLLVSLLTFHDNASDMSSG